MLVIIDVVCGGVLVVCVYGLVLCGSMCLLVVYSLYL